jgi:hypothetical protein
MNYIGIKVQEACQKITKENENIASMETEINNI